MLIASTAGSPDCARRKAEGRPFTPADLHAVIMRGAVERGVRR
jgi:hypothetical protein